MNDTQERKLATIRKIQEVKPITGADKICAYRVDGWWVVDQVGKYTVGDLVVYLEVDSWVSTEIAPFLSKGKEPREYEGVKGERLRTIRLKGQLSQGLLLPLHEVIVTCGCHSSLYEGMDVTEWLGILKWERPINAQLAGLIRGNFPPEIPKTSQERIQNLTKEFEGLQQEQWAVTEKLDGCFLGTQYLDTWSGSSVQMIDIVKNGQRPELVGVNDKGEIVPCAIINTFNNGKKENWVDVKFTPYTLSGIVGKSGKLRVTANHKIFLENMSESSAEDLTTGDTILMQEMQYCPVAMHYFKSSLLGDGCVTGGGHYSYNEGHVEKHIEFMNYIKQIFSDVPFSSRSRISGYGSKMHDMKMFSTSQLRLLRNEWYPDGKKILPSDISWIDDFSVAKWYIDDGSLSHSKEQNDRALFAANAFSESDANRLAAKLVELYGVNVTVYFSKGWVIRINYTKGTIDRFWEGIAKHIPLCMRYKLPSGYRDLPFVQYPKAAKLSRRLVPVKVVSVERVAPTKQNFPHGTTGYDIQTTTHNYFCGGILVHNCSATFYLDPTGDFHVCSRNLDLAPDENNLYWKIAIKNDIENKMRNLGLLGHAIQGEIIGEGIQGNQYKRKPVLHLFDVFSVPLGNYISLAGVHQVAAQLDIKTVPVVERDFPLQHFTIEELLKYAEGESQLNDSQREGLVYQCLEHPEKSFKVISNAWLLGNE